MRTEREASTKFGPYTAHAAAELFPLMSDSELAELAEDIKEHGLKYPIVRRDGVILDGRNRLRACELAGVAPDFRELDAEECADPVAFVVSSNLQRRHLGASQRALIAAQLATLAKGDNQHTARAVPSQGAAAKLMNVSADSVQRARTVVEKGVPELVQADRAGEVPVKAAAVVAKLPAKEQKKLVEKGPTAVTKKAKETKATSPRSPTVTSPADRNWTFLPIAPLPTEEQWRVLRVQLFAFLDLTAARVSPKSKGKYACVLRDLRERLCEVARNPTQAALFESKVTPVGTHQAQARNGAPR